MDNTRSLGQRVVSAVVATLTIVWAAGAAAFVVPQTASAAQAGDLIRGTSFSTVYFYGYDGSRYIFPNEKTYDTWFNGFAGVQTLSDAAVAAIPVAGNVVYRPGSRWIKITTAAETYAVGRDGMIHWVETEAVATGLAGSDWNQSIDDVPDAFFDNYTEGVSLTSSEVWDGALYMDGADYYVAWDGEKHMLSSAARSANALETRFFLDGASIDDSGLDAGDDFTGFVCALSDASQSGDCEVAPVGGDLSVSLASTTAPSTTVPDAANGVAVTTWKITADEATELSGLVLSYNGLASQTVVDEVYVYEGNARLTDGRSFNSSTKTATFASLNLQFNAGQTRYISAVVDLNDSYDANGTFRIGLASANDVTSNGDVSGSFPSWGNTHSVIDADVSSLTIERQGAATATYSVGTSDAVIGRFSAEAGDEDIEIEAITVTVEDAGDHSAYALYQSGTKVATGTNLREDLVFFPLTTPFFIEEGNTRNFEVRATLGGESTDTVTTYIENAADVRATDLESGFGANVDVTDYDTVGEATVITLEGGAVTLAFNGPIAQDVRATAANHEFLNFSITSEEWAEVQSLTAAIVGTDLYDGDWALTDIRLVNAKTGTLLSSVEITGGDANDKNVTFDDSFVIKAGETLELAITADIEEDVVEENDTISISVLKADQTGAAWDIENVDGDAITDVIPSSGITGKNQTVIDSGLTVSLAGSPSGDKTVVRGAQDVTFVRYNFSAADGGEIEVTDLTLTVQSDDDGTLGSAVTDLLAEDYIQTCSLYEGTTLVAGPESPDSSNGLAGGVDTIEFQNFSWAIAGGEDAVLSVICDLVDANPASGAELAITIEDSTDVEALDDEGDSVVVSGTANTAGSTKVSVGSTGGLVATVAASSPAEKFVLAGSTDQSVSTFRFDASNEDFRVNDLTLVEVGGGEEAIESVTISYPSNAAGTLATRTTSMVGSNATFQNIGMYVKQNTPAYVTVKVNIADTSRDNGDAVSNSYVEFELADDTGEFEAQGVASSELVTDAVASATETSAADRHVVRESVPTITATTGSGLLFNGSLSAYNFTIAASATEDVVVDHILFQLSGSGDWNACSGTDAHNLDGTEFTLEQGSTLVDEVTWSLHTSTLETLDADDCTGAGAPTSSDVKYVRVTFNDGEGEVIPAGSSKSYELTIDVTGAEAEDALQISIPRESALLGTQLDNLTTTNEALDATETEVTLASATGLFAGSIIEVGSEYMLVAEINSGTSVEVIRGYAGTTAASHLTAQNVDVTVTPFLWQDDGTQDRDDNAATEAYWGADLVTGLTATGKNLVW